ncbi:MAG: YfhO family protein [Bacilli bacterium]|nr:YfhO family protein [Bacilli bacterium]
MKNHKKDIIYISILVLTFIVLSVFTIGRTYMYGSSLDWYAQHISIPEYFRTLFYNTKDILPDFALNIGNGQNIYNFSYYGLLSPYILISYLLPMFNMSNILVVLTIISVIASTILMYYFLRKHEFTEEVSFIATLCFTLSSPIVFQSHRHIMFINYMPFLLMGLYGVDKRIKNRKSWLLVLSVFLMLMTSYYYSIGGILCLLLYAFYRFLQKTKKISLKIFFKTLFFFLGPILIGIFMSSIITIPTLLTMFNNRLDSNTSINLVELLLPLPKNFENVLYSSYSLGLPIVIVPALINFFKKEKANITIGIILVLLFSINLFNYILNGTMYIDPKTLIPFLPIYTYVIAIFFKDLFNKEINYKVLFPVLLIVSIYIIISKSLRIHYILELLLLAILLVIHHKIPKKRIIIIPLFFLILGNAYVHNLLDNLELRYEVKETDTLITDSLNTITTADDTFYRTSLDVNKSEYPNKIFENIGYYNSTIYSSISNVNYNNFYYDVLSNNIAYRNRALTTTTSNIVSLMLMGNKYIISYKKPLQGYELINTNNGLNIYKNNNVLPLGVATNKTMSYSDFEKLDYSSSQEALLNVIITDQHSNNEFVSNIIKTDILISDLISNDIAAFEGNGKATLKVEKEYKTSFSLPKKYQDKILFIRFKVNNEYTNDRSITINGIKNKVTDKDWKYYNDNSVFDYVLNYQDLKKLNITISKGEYNITDFEIDALDYSYLEQATKNFDKLIVDSNKTKGDFIVGDINVTNKGYLMLTIPYSNGFNIKLDGKKIDYEKVDYSFIGFPIEEGTHHLEIEYKAPGKNISLFISIISLISYIAVIILEDKRKI